MNVNSSLPISTFEPISNIRITRMPTHPQPSDKLYISGGVMFRLAERFVYKPRLNPGSAWKLYDGVTVPRKEDLIFVGNPDKRASKLVYTLADQAEYRMLDICEIPFVTLAATRTVIDVLFSALANQAEYRTLDISEITSVTLTTTRTVINGQDFGQQSSDQAEYPVLDICEIPFVTLATTIINGHRRMDFGQQSNNTFEAAPRSQIQTQTHPVISTPSVIVTARQPKRQAQPRSASPVAACIAAVTSYFDFTSPSGHTAQKRSRENAFEEDEDIETNPRQRRRFASPWSSWCYRRVLKA